MLASQQISFLTKPSEFKTCDICHPNPQMYAQDTSVSTTPVSGPWPLCTCGCGSGDAEAGT